MTTLRVPIFLAAVLSLTCCLGSDKPSTSSSASSRCFSAQERAASPTASFSSLFRSLSLREGLDELEERVRLPIRVVKPTPLRTSSAIGSTQEPAPIEAVVPIAQSQHKQPTESRQDAVRKKQRQAIMAGMANTSYEPISPQSRKRYPITEE